METHPNPFADLAQRLDAVADARWWLENCGMTGDEIFRVTVDDGSYGKPGLMVQIGTLNSATLFAKATRALTRNATLGSITKDYSGSLARIGRDFGTFKVEFFTGRDNVCTKRVIGKEMVEVPDPAAPKVTVEREIVEWDCGPVLSTEAR